MQSHDEQAAAVDVPAGASGEAPPEGAAAEAGGGGDDAAAIRDLVLRAYPDVVPELIAGETVAEMLASVPAAREAYQRAVEAARAAGAVPEPVPAGGGRAALDVESLSPALKIRMGLERRGRE